MIFTSPGTPNHRLEGKDIQLSNGIFSLLAFVGAEYWIYATNDSSGKGQAIKVKVEMTNEPLKLVIPFPKRTEQ